MSKHHEKPKRVAEPVQVYLERPDAIRLGQLADQLDATKSDVLRRGLLALERELQDPAHHPALGVIGIAGAGSRPPVTYDVAREHDRFLADTEPGVNPAPKRKARGR
jgi:hypothetical protein